VLDYSHDNKHTTTPYDDDTIDGFKKHTTTPVKGGVTTGGASDDELDRNGSIRNKRIGSPNGKGDPNGGGLVLEDLESSGYFEKVSHEDKKPRFMLKSGGGNGPQQYDEDGNPVDNNGGGGSVMSSTEGRGINPVRPKA